MHVVIKSIPAGEFRYPSAGDYWDDPDGTKQIRVLALQDWRHELLLAVHELVEAFICDHRGIAEPDIMAFDVEFERNRAPGNLDEPGFASDAPYRAEHTFATAVEMLLAQQLGVDWKKYQDLLDSQ